jgi:uncharacterized membrane protein (UPF0182 family)
VLYNGHVVWLIDGFTTSNTFPIARRITIDGVGSVRSLRNSVKATVDAVSGEVTLYAFDEEDPLLRTYSRVFPELFTPGNTMPADLRSHVRYPVMFLREQAQILGQYHLSAPEAFYRGEDVWQLPTTANRADRPENEFTPVYQMMRMPGETTPAYVLAAPFIARQRRNMTALLVVQNDPARYGELTLLELPRNQSIAGPGQVERLVEQDPVIRPQLALWRQAGSEVLLGRPRVMPIDSGLIYMIPLFLTASSAQGSPIPELQRIIVSDGSRVAMAPTLEGAVNGVFSGDAASEPATRVSTPTTTATAPAQTSISRRALDLLDRAEQALRTGDYAGFGRHMNELRQYLQNQQ